MKTDIQENVGKHRFEVAGLGLAPFRFVGFSENAIKLPDGTMRAGGCCDFCGTGIRFECHIQSADGQRHKVGTDCIAKIDDSGLLKAFKTSPEFRKHQADLRFKKSQKTVEELKALIAARADQLRSQPHPRGFVDRQTGVALTALDEVQWLMDHCGDSGRKALCKRLRAM